MQVTPDWRLITQQLKRKIPRHNFLQQQLLLSPRICSLETRIIILCYALILCLISWHPLKLADVPSRSIFPSRPQHQHQHQSHNWISANCYPAKKPFLFSLISCQQTSAFINAAQNKLVLSYNVSFRYLCSWPDDRINRTSPKNINQHLSFTELGQVGQCNAQWLVSCSPEYLFAWWGDKNPWLILCGKTSPTTRILTFNRLE